MSYFRTNNGYNFNSLPNCSWVILFILIGFFFSGCRLDYKPLSDDLGYSIKYIDENKYRIEYYAPTKFEYENIDNLLLKFATDICDSEFSLEKFKEEVVENPKEINLDKNLPKIKVVSSILKCTSLNKLMIKNPSFPYP